MPEFDTPEPITVEMDLLIADVRLTASERVNTVIDVRPSDPAEDNDVRAAERTHVERTPAGLLIEMSVHLAAGLPAEQCDLLEKRRVLASPGCVVQLP